MTDLVVQDGKFPPELVAEIAILSETSGSLALTSEALICKKFNMTPERLEYIRSLPVFQSAVANTVKELRESHGIPRMKSALAFEATLDNLFPIWLADPDWSPLAKVKLAELMAEYGGIKAAASNAGEVKSQGASAPTITINLTNFTPATTTTVIDI